MSTAHAVQDSGKMSANDRKVAFATIIGTTIEWYDFFIYAAAAGLVFTQLFFAPAGHTLGTLLAFATVGLSFLFRPLGAFLAGHFGDKIGRRAILVVTLICMGLSTALIGLLPTYDSIGLWAPILLLLLRIIQGLSAGGEWGGAVLMAVEHAPVHKRGRFGSFPQIGVPLGLLLASGMFALMSGVIAPGDAFLEWGWRVPFLFSIVLLFVGHWMRKAVEESPVFEEIKERGSASKTPVMDLFKNHFWLVITAALVFAGNSAIGYMTTGGFIQNYTTNPDGPLTLPRTPILISVTVSAAVWLLFTWISGGLSDKIGRRNTYIIGFIIQLAGVLALFPLVNIGTIWSVSFGLCFLSIGIGMSFSGVSISYAIGAILGGAFSPLIASWLISMTGSTAAVAFYLAAMTLIGLGATLILRDRSGIPLGPEYEDLQNESAFSIGKNKSEHAYSK